MGSTFWLAALGSAAVGALVSAIITFIGQLLERRARRKELLMNIAAKLAFERIKTGMRMAEKTGRPAIIKDAATLMVDYYKNLQYLWDEDDSLPEQKKIEAESLAKAREFEAQRQEALKNQQPPV